MAEHVILFAGPMGAGKTTAIQSLSEIPVVATEAANSDRAQADKDTTTVAFDYGEITVGADEKVRLYGVPGQRRFSFMWKLLAERATGLVLLVHNDAEDSIGRMLDTLVDFEHLIDRGGVVVGVTRLDLGLGPAVADYGEALAEASNGPAVPVLQVDPRSPSDMRILLMTMVANIEMRAALRGFADASAVTV